MSEDDDNDDDNDNLDKKVVCIISGRTSLPVTKAPHHQSDLERVHHHLPALNRIF